MPLGGLVNLYKPALRTISVRSRPESENGSPTEMGVPKASLTWVCFIGLGLIFTHSSVRTLIMGTGQKAHQPVERFGLSVVRTLACKNNNDSLCIHQGLAFTFQISFKLDESWISGRR